MKPQLDDEFIEALMEERSADRVRHVQGTKYTYKLGEEIANGVRYFG